VVLAYQGAPAAPLRLPGLAARPVPLHNGTAKFDLALEVADSPGGLAGQLEYAADLFDPATAARLLGHLGAVLAAAAADPDRPLSALPLLAEAERRQVLAEFNRTAADFPRDRCVHELFAEQAARTPAAVAVACGRRRLTYAELDRRADRLAARLRALGAGPGSLVALCLERSPEMVVALLGVLKAGAAYVPLDPAYPPERLAFMLADARPPVLLTQRPLLARLPPFAGRALCLGPGGLPPGGPAPARPAPAPARRPAPEDLAYVVYTSGSTGAPKGVAVPHRALANYLAWCRAAYGAGPRDAPVHSPLAFDLTVTALFAPLLGGGAVHLLPEGPGVDALAAALRAHPGFGLVKLTPAHLDLLARDPAAAAAAARAGALVVGGESLAAERLAPWRGRAPAPALVNEYGPTEATVGCCARRVGPDDPPAGPVPIGRPIANARCYVVDRWGGPAPVGVPGELLVGGAGLARGYLNRPGLTAERFVPDPFSGEPGARLYRTGDLARWLPSGDLEFLGRLDHQVKVRGFRVEPAEVEAALARHPAVREAAVVAREDAPGERRLVAYLVPRPGHPAPAPDELRPLLQRSLPDYMLPAAFVPLEALPLTPNGKLDRAALPAPGPARPELAQPYAPPRSPAEEALAAIWAEVLGLERVGVRDNFFDLGGDSILAIRMVAGAARRGLRLTVRSLFQHQTVAELAAVAGAGAPAEAEQGPVTGPVPLTPIQRWFFEQRPPAPHHFNQAALRETPPGADPALLRAAVGHLLAHHDALRLRFRREGRRWVQAAAPPGGPVPFERADLSAVPEAARPAAIERRAALAQASLDIARGPLLRAVLLDLGPGPGRLLLAVHHLAVDIVSWQPLLEDLQAAYDQLSRGAPVRLPPKTTSFKRWAEGLAEYARSAELRREAPYWLDEARARARPLPVDRPGGRNTRASARTLVAALGPEDTAALLQEVPRAYRTQVNDALLAALARAVARWAGPGPLLVDLEGHGREDVVPGADLSRTVGWFTAIAPVLLDLAGAPGPGEALRAVKEQLRRLPHGGIGYGLLRYLAGDPALAARLRALPPPGLCFNYAGRPAAPRGGAPFPPAPEPCGPARAPRGRRRHLLEVDAAVADGRLRVAWTYSANLHRRATVAALAALYLEELRALVAHCLSPDAGALAPSDFPLAATDAESIARALAQLTLGAGD
jgi:amino acid adenylation domain-containing protein/non-ribosomal peptide synthase protein (TIGR01720 family)